MTGLVLLLVSAAAAPPAAHAAPSAPLASALAPVSVAPSALRAAAAPQGAPPAAQIPPPAPTVAPPTRPPSADTLTLEAALDAALKRDPRLAAARAGADAARAVRTEAKAAWLPLVTTNGTLTRFEEPMLVMPIHTFQPINLPAFDQTLLQGHLNVGWTVFDGGARGARIAAAGANAEGAQAGAGQAAMDALLEVLGSYLKVEGARETVAAQRTREQDLTAEAARAERFVNEGAAPRLELLQAQAELDEARAYGIGVDATLAEAEADLARSIGAPTASVAGVEVAAVQLRAAAPPTEDDVSPDHPALRAARARAAAAAALIREARSHRLPRVQSNGAVIGYGSAAGDFTAEWQAGLQADYEIFAGGARGARVDAAQAQARQAEAEERDVAESLAQANDQAMTALREATARAQAQATAVARFEELTRVQTLALSEGAGVQADYLRALAGLYAARLGLADARRAVVLASARAAAVQGRLDRAWIATHLERAP